MDGNSEIKYSVIELLYATYNAPCAVTTLYDIQCYTIYICISPLVDVECVVFMMNELCRILYVQIDRRLMSGGVGCDSYVRRNVYCEDEYEFPYGYG